MASRSQVSFREARFRFEKFEKPGFSRSSLFSTCQHLGCMAHQRRRTTAALPNLLALFSRSQVSFSELRCGPLTRVRGLLAGGGSGTLRNILAVIHGPAALGRPGQAAGGRKAPARQARYMQAAATQHAAGWHPAIACRGRLEGPSSDRRSRTCAALVCAPVMHCLPLIEWRRQEGIAQGRL